MVKHKKVTVLYLSLYQCNLVLSRKIIKKVWIFKEFQHGVIHPFSPISLIKEAITPLGTLSVEHLIEKRDLHHEHTRKARDAEDIELPNIEQVVEPDAVIETQKEILSQNKFLTDIILTRVEFHRGKPVDAIKLQSITFPGETNQDSVGSLSTDINSDSVAQASSKESVIENEPESEPPKETEKIDGESEKFTEPKADVELISNVEEKKNEEEDKKEKLQDGKESQLELLETTDEKVSGEVAQGSEESPGVIENRETVSEAINDNVGAIPVKSEPLVEVTPKPIETPALPVSPLPQPIYIPLYTDVKTPVPIPVQPVISEVVVTATPVVVVTEKEVVVAPPPPPPVQTETTVIQTEQTPGLFTRGSRFMLNVSSRILRKLLRLVSRVQSRIPLPPAEA
ncbi:unnamed protein product [Pieris brassicae]|uniref:Uncharacterized protein n=1 Tax=Pieris brassicae TaxID=7116 RepID=A0A9P0TKF4_PIEBR|nr:unnamed protein product [Pieris brassicae]